MEKLKYILGWILIFLFNAFSWANNTSGGGSGAADIEFETVDDKTEDGESIGMPGHMEGTQARPNVSIDMYEGILIGVAVLLIVGYIYYNYTQRSKRLLS